MKKLIALLPLLLLAACADPAYSPGAWANYDGTYDWGFSGYERPYAAAAYAAPVYYPPSYNYGPAYSYGPPAGYGPPAYSSGYSYSYGGGYAPSYYDSYYEGPGYGPY